MANKTFIPAFKAKVGDWNYYICHMKYGEVAKQIQFAYELGGNADLHTMIQRGISSRTNDITEYLLNSPHRFLGSLIVAAWKGHPEYTAIQMEDPDEMLKGLDRDFGLLTFDGSQLYFALDGQHRLRAIKDALKKNPDLADEDICVILVAHFDSPEGRLKTRRLFTNINRNAKTTTGAENIVLDEDDGLAILTRRFLTDHDLFSKDKVIKVFQKQGTEGDITLAGSSVPKTDPKSLSTISVLYNCLSEITFGLDASMKDPTARPTGEILDESYKVLSNRIDDLLSASGDIRSLYEATPSARDLRAPKDSEGTGHAFMRPVIQRAVFRVTGQICEQDRLGWKELMKRLGQLDWAIGSAPWTAVFNPSNNKMFGSKEFSNLLDELLLAHIAPVSKQSIRRARKNYKELIGAQYPITDEKMFSNIVSEEEVESG